jgi:ribosome-binding factor A
MGQRTVRVNELIKREISLILRRDYRVRATPVTITDVETSPDLRSARVYYSVLGDESVREDASSFLSSIKKELRRKVFTSVVLKYTPDLRFIYDPSIERGNTILDIINEIDREEDRHS